MKTRILMAALAALCMASTAGAAELVNIGGGSYHFERDLGHNEFNYGIGYEKDWREDVSWTVGVYKNSIRRASFYALANWYALDLGAGFRAGLTGGLMTGYHQSPVIGTLMPTLEWRGEHLALQSYVVPTIKPYIDGAVVLQLKYVFSK
ncbi:hypothetical protein Q9Q94_17925 [Uliginosibacterium sp. 31-16]|uniref:hypothetical protein n=1 Tax=Uliginosibacterium sp. 31-16 TaxID=3068315 RepID=UPI00273DFE76|nr:hypothetical protein [Uliginosibacterium sp. 31-16]MDP5241416.1 hypothetical protein [Uliginosibacterium sp. 31-16]